MDAASGVAPIIIKKVKKGGGDGHHGGAWKVAYADFVTAMMAFFMLMWLLNATTEKQRKGIADYFTPTISVSRVSGGGDGMFGGDSVFTEQTLARNGTGASMEYPTESNRARGIDSSDSEKQGETEELKGIESQLMGRGGESLLNESALKHVNTQVTDKGLVIDLFDFQEQALFVPGTAEPTQLLRELARVIQNVSQVVTNGIAVEGFVASEPLVIARSQMWSLSSERALAMRALLSEAGVPEDRLRRVTGHANRAPLADDPMSNRNNRLEVILLRDLQN